ncbi:MAG: nitrilase-related carbon-nitrogen hydrolase [Coraliomargarita sp.]
MKIAIAQFSVERARSEKNIEQIQGFASEASAAGAACLLLPEMCTTGFDWSYNRELLDRAHEQTEQIAAFGKEYKIAIAGSFLEKTERGNAANTLHLFNSNGVLEMKYRKIHLFTLFSEERHVEAGGEVVTADTELGRIGCSVCYDLRFPELFRSNALAGASIQLLPAAFPHPRLAHWQTLIRARAIENQCYFIAVNQCGHETHGGDVGQIHYFGHSMVVDPWGEVVLEAGEDAGLFFAEIDPSLVIHSRERLPALRDRRENLY